MYVLMAPIFQRNSVECPQQTNLIQAVMLISLEKLHVKMLPMIRKQIVICGLLHRIVEMSIIISSGLRRMVLRVDAQKELCSCLGLKIKRIGRMVMELNFLTVWKFSAFKIQIMQHLYRSLYPTISWNVGLVMQERARAFLINR